MFLSKLGSVNFWFWRYNDHDMIKSRAKWEEIWQQFVTRCKISDSRFSAPKNFVIFLWRSSELSDYSKWIGNTTECPWAIFQVLCIKWNLDSLSTLMIIIFGFSFVSISIEGWTVCLVSGKKAGGLRSCGAHLAKSWEGSKLQTNMQLSSSNSQVYLSTAFNFCFSRLDPFILQNPVRDCHGSWMRSSYDIYLENVWS